MRRRFWRNSKPRLVAISVARDEADVIEPFVRHTAALVDHHLIVDHCSNDRTPEILRALAGEGLSLSVLHCADPIYNQPPVTNVLMKRAVESFAADWVLPLDADEFIAPPVGGPEPEPGILHQAISSAAPRGGCLIYPFRTYHPHELDAEGEVNVVRRMGHRFVRETGEYHKILVSRDLALDADGWITPGNHHFEIGGQRVATEPLPGFALAHYAVRSMGQYVRKIVAAELGKDSFGKKRKGLGTQKTAPFELLKASPAQFFAGALKAGREVIPHRGCYLGGELRYTEAEDEVAATLSSVLSMSHDIARQLGALRDQHREKGIDPLADTSGVKLEPVEETPAGEEPPGRAPSRSPVVAEESLEDLLPS